MQALAETVVRRVRPLLWLGLMSVVLLLTVHGLDAHKAVTSRYTYKEHVFPILRDKCGRCHVDGGAAPMSLMSYKEKGGAVAWAESMREMLVSEAMPPWYVDPTGPAVRNSRSLSPRELDILVTWAAGGTPEGDLNSKLPSVAAQNQWGLGTPDLVLPMPQAHTVPASAMEEAFAFALPTGLTEARWVKAADLLPGTASIVRRAVIAVENGPVLAVWEPGDEASPAPGGAAFRLQAGAKLSVRIHYKKSWQDEQQEKSDKSSIGLYFTEEPLSGKEIQAFAIDGPKSESQTTEPLTFSGTLTTAGRVLGLRPSLNQAFSSFEVQAVAASGRRVPLLKLRAARPEWPRRYWLADAVELPAGTKIEVTATPADRDSGPLLGTPANSPLQVALDVVPQ